MHLPMTNLLVFLPPPLRLGFQPEAIRYNQTNRNDRRANDHEPAVVFHFAKLLGFLGGAFGVLGCDLR